MEPNYVTFITAAYGTAYHRIVKGLARTFSRHNSSELIIYTDAADLAMPGCRMDNSIPLETLKQYSGPLPLRSSKIRILSHAAEKYEHICWIDADMLVYTNLSKKIVTGRINSIAYGYGKKLRDCGGNLKVPQNQYAMSGLFSASREDLLQFERIWLELKDSVVKNVTLYDQSVLNHLIARNQTRTRDLTAAHRNLIWNFEKFYKENKSGSGHPSPTNKLFCKSLKLKDNRLYYKETPFAVLYWTSRSLMSHLDTHFNAIQDKRVRKHFIELYK